MTTVTISDRLHAHRKVRLIPRRQRMAAIGLWTVAASWTAFYDEDGFVPRSTARTSLEDGRGALAARLVEVDLWRPAVKLGEDGYDFVLDDGLIEFRPAVTAPIRPSRDRIPVQLRRAVYDRDDWRCVECGATEDLTLDHIWPWSKGGADAEENLRTLCRSCNSRKGARV